MSYEVSQSTKDALQTLLDTKQVMQALQFAENDQEEIIQRQMELALIPSPTFHEEKKAARFLEMFKEEGLENCHIDEYGNCIGIRRGTGSGKTLLVEGHLDTVFPMETELKITRENGVIHCPGIVDDTRGCVVLLSVIRALNVAGIKTKGDIQFVGTVQEEGMGSLGGMRYYLEHHPEIDGSISVDGPGYHGVTFEATGFKTYEVNFYGIGGHASGAFGKIANPLHAAARAVAKIADFQVPTDPRTTFAVTNFHAGSPASVHAIVPKAQIMFNFRSNSQEELDKLDKRIFDAIQQACDEETARWGKDTITFDYKRYCEVPAGAQDPHSPIVEASIAISNYLGCEEPKLAHGGSTNCNMAIGAGIPSVCLGDCDYDTNCHTLREHFIEREAYKGCQQTLLLALLCAGTEVQDSIL